MLETDLSDERKTEAISALEAFARHGYAQQSVTKILGAVREHEAPAEAAMQALVRIAQALARGRGDNREAGRHGFEPRVSDRDQRRTPYVSRQNVAKRRQRGSRSPRAGWGSRWSSSTSSNCSRRTRTPDTRGACDILQVTGAPATEAGWKPGDTIVGIGKWAVTDLEAARYVLQHLAANRSAEKTTVLLLRGNDTLASLVNVLPPTYGAVGPRLLTAEEAARDLNVREQKLKSIFRIRMSN